MGPVATTTAVLITAAMFNPAPGTGWDRSRNNNGTKPRPTAPARTRQNVPAAPRTASPVTRIRLVAAGDVVFGRMYGRKLTNFGYQQPFQHVKPLIAGHDIAMANLETPITSRRYRWMARSILVFRAVPAAAQLLHKAGFTLMVTANNHSRDQGDRGLNETLKHLKAASLSWVGTGNTRSRAWTPYIYEKNGVKVGVLAFTTIRNYNRPMNRAYFAYLTESKVLRYLPYQVKKLKRKTDFVVVVGHHGREYKTRPPRRSRRWMRRLAKAGCDLFIGHHPHVLQGIQRFGTMLVYYSLGNFLFDMGWEDVRKSGLARVVFIKDEKGPRIQRAEFVPIFLGNDYRPRPATGTRARQIIKEVMEYSKLPGGTPRFWTRGNHLQIAVK